MPPKNRLLPTDTNTEVLPEDLPTFQEDVLGGTLGVEIGNDLDNLDPTGLDEITDLKEIEVLSKKRKTHSLNEKEELEEQELEEEELDEEEEVVEESEESESEDEEEEEEAEEQEEAIRGRSGRRKRIKKNSCYVYF